MEAGNGPLKMAQFKFRESCPCNTFSQTKIGANGDKGLGQGKIKKKTKKGVGKILKCCPKKCCREREREKSERDLGRKREVTVNIETETRESETG